MLSNRVSKIEVKESELQIATREFVAGQGHEKYLEQLQVLANQPINGQTEFERGIQEGERRVYLNLINSLRG